MHRASSLGIGKVSPPLYEGKGFSLASKDIELERSIPRESFLSRACFGHSMHMSSSISTATSKKAPVKEISPPSLHKSQLKPAAQRMPIYPTSKSASDDNNHSVSLSEITNLSLHWTANWCVVICLTFALVFIT